MAQNLASVHFTAAQWAALDETISAMERAWEPMLVVLPPGGRNRTKKMGDRSEAFCRNAHRAMCESPHAVPRDMDLDEMGRDLASHDELALRRIRIDRLVEKLIDTDIALGSDVMAAALRGYAHLKVSGRAEGSQVLCDGLGRQFAKRRRRTRAAVAEPA